MTKEVISSLMANATNPFHLLPSGNDGAIWVKPDHVCVVEYMPNTRQSLRQPVFKGFRDDVSPEEVCITEERT